MRGWVITGKCRIWDFKGFKGEDWALPLLYTERKRGSKLQSNTVKLKASSLNEYQVESRRSLTKKPAKCEGPKTDLYAENSYYHVVYGKVGHAVYERSKQKRIRTQLT